MPNTVRTVLAIICIFVISRPRWRTDAFHIALFGRSESRRMFLQRPAPIVLQWLLSGDLHFFSEKWLIRSCGLI
jgi:hypothetical protein